MAKFPTDMHSHILRSRSEKTRHEREWAAAMLLRTGARDRAAAVARKYMDDSRAALDSMPQNCYTEALFGMADFVMLRDS